MKAEVGSETSSSRRMTSDHTWIHRLAFTIIVHVEYKSWLDQFHFLYLSILLCVYFANIGHESHKTQKVKTGNDSTAPQHIIMTLFE